MSDRCECGECECKVIDLKDPEVRNKVIEDVTNGTSGLTKVSGLFAAFYPTLVAVPTSALNLWATMSAILLNNAGVPQNVIEAILGDLHHKTIQ